MNPTSNMQSRLSQSQSPVTLPSIPKNKDSMMPPVSMRSLCPKEPFNSTQQILSAVSAIHVASSPRPVYKPHSTGTMAAIAMRSPQLKTGSNVSCSTSFVNVLYEGSIRNYCKASCFSISSCNCGAVMVPSNRLVYSIFL